MNSYDPKKKMGTKLIFSDYTITFKNGDELLTIPCL